MTCDELKAAINSEIAQNARIAAIRSRIDAGTADFLDSELYTAITAEITAKQMQRNVLALSDREPAFVGVVRERYTDTFSTFNAVQRILDAVTGIRIRTVQPEFENDRAHKIGHSLNDPTVPESVIERRAYSATENFVRSQHDRCTQANASFRSRAGLDCRITRTGGAKCCDWCASVSGSFTTSSAPDGIWGRHDNCKCSITYETRRGSFQQLSGTGKGWDTVEELPDLPLHVPDGETVGAGEVHAVSAGQAQALQAEKGLTKGEKHGIMNIRLDDIKAAVTGSPITEEVAEYIFGVLAEQRNQFKFDGVKVVDIDSKIVMQTDPVQNGTFYDIVLNLNSAFLGGKTVEQLDAEIKASKVTRADSFREAVIHEIYHGKTYYGKNKGEIDALYEVLEGIQIDGISRTAYKDGFECIAEVGVLYERGETTDIPERAKDLFFKYMGVKI